MEHSDGFCQFVCAVSMLSYMHSCMSVRMKNDEKERRKEEKERKDGVQ